MLTTNFKSSGCEPLRNSRIIIDLIIIIIIKIKSDAQTITVYWNKEEMISYHLNMIIIGIIDNDAYAIMHVFLFFYSVDAMLVCSPHASVNMVRRALQKGEFNIFLNTPTVLCILVTLFISEY